MNFPLVSNVNPESVESCNMGEYRPLWQDPFAELRTLSSPFACANPGSSQAAEMNSGENPKKKISDRVRRKMKREGKSEECWKEQETTRPPTAPLKEEDPEKVRIRRQRNKIAATKCRRKRRERIKILKKQIEALESSQTKMEEEISSLRKQKASLDVAFSNHWCVLGQGLTQTQSQASSSCTRTDVYPTPALFY